MNICVVQYMSNICDFFYIYKFEFALNFTMHIQLICPCFFFLHCLNTYMFMCNRSVVYFLAFTWLIDLNKIVLLVLLFKRNVCLQFLLLKTEKHSPHFLSSIYMFIVVLYLYII